jgi:hypothetical protein
MLIERCVPVPALVNCIRRILFFSHHLFAWELFTLTQGDDMLQENMYTVSGRHARRSENEGPSP